MRSGIVLPEQAAETYFNSRPEGSKVSAAASVQTAVIADRSELQRKVDELRAAFPDGDVPRPQAWLGYRLIPESFEFWQGRLNRLHDRFLYKKQEGGGWSIDRLAP